MLSGRRFNGQEAEKYGLVNASFADDVGVNEYLDGLTSQLKTSGPKAMSQCKELLFQVCNHWTLKQAYDKTAEMIADIRSSEEGQEGMAAFLEKRKPNWVN
jgi:methylglutaconyl-CoA hydratase